MYDYSLFPRIRKLLDSAKATGRDEPLIWGQLLSPESTGKAAALADIETTLQELDPTNWTRFLSKAGHTTALHVSQERGWERMTDMFSEAEAYVYLKRRYGAPDFIPEAKKQKRPDLQVALDDGSTMLCEVKTINRSEYSIRTFGEVSSSPKTLHPSFYRRIGEAIERGRGQINNYEPATRLRKVIFLHVNFDDIMWWEYASYYAKKVDEYIEKYPLDDLEVVVHLPPSKV